MVALVKKLIQEWLKYNDRDEVQVFTFDHLSLEEIPPGYSVVVRIEKWSPINLPKVYETRTMVPGYDADLSD
jgi:hypothetical protein